MLQRAQEGDCKLRYFLFRVIRNRCYSELRRQERTPWPLAPGPWPLAPGPGLGGPIHPAHGRGGYLGDAAPGGSGCDGPAAGLATFTVINFATVPATVFQPLRVKH